MPDVLQELLSCDVVFRPGHQVSSCLGVSAVREFVSLPLAVCAVPGCPGQCLYEVGQDLAIRAHDAAVFCPYPVDAVGVAEGENLPRGPGTPFVVCATAAESDRSEAGAPPVLRRWRHHLPGKSAGGRDHDQRPVRGADCEGSRVIRLENAQDVGDLFAVTRAGPAPADHDPLAGIGGWSGIAAIRPASADYWNPWRGGGSGRSRNWRWRRLTTLSVDPPRRGCER